MKKRNKKIIIITSIIFIIIMSIIIVFFMYKNKNISLTNKANILLEELYKMDEGSYILDDGYIYSQIGVKISDKKYIEANGKIEIDKYKNVKFNLEIENKCINKNTLGDVKVLNECPQEKRIDVQISKNNNEISFITEESNLEYLISEKDNLKGEWIKKEYKDSILITAYNEGINYIWFKDKDGNVSEPISFNVECLNTTNANYDKEVFYCTGSTIILDEEKWIVIKDKKETITLMKLDSLEERLSHCTTESSSYCHTLKKEKIDYKWSTSFINYYLNNVYIEMLSDDVKKSLVDTSVCNDYRIEGCKDNEGCGGTLKEDIISKDWYCEEYTNSKVRLITYQEYNRIFFNLKDNYLANQTYWSMNSYLEDYGSSIQDNYEYYIKENLTSKLEVKPVITILK